jgi:lysophospholipase L1-like esterase
VKLWLKSSALIYFLKERLEELVGRIRGRDDNDYHQGIWARADNRQKVEAGFDALRRLRETHGFGVVVLIWPLLTPHDPYPFAEIHAWVAEQAEARGFDVVDLRPRFAAIPFRELQVTPEDGVHPNGRGHAIGVEALVAWLRERAG